MCCGVLDEAGGGCDGMHIWLAPNGTWTEFAAPPPFLPPAKDHSDTIGTLSWLSN